MPAIDTGSRPDTFALAGVVTVPVTRPVVNAESVAHWMVTSVSVHTVFAGLLPLPGLAMVAVNDAVLPVTEPLTTVIGVVPGVASTVGGMTYACVVKSLSAENTPADAATLVAFTRTKYCVYSSRPVQVAVTVTGLVPVSGVLGDRFVPAIVLPTGKLGSVEHWNATVVDDPFGLTDTSRSAEVWVRSGAPAVPETSGRPTVGGVSAGAVVNATGVDELTPVGAAEFTARMRAQ